MIEKMRVFFEREYENLMSVATNKPRWMKIKDFPACKNQYIDRILGVAMFVSLLDDAPEYQEVEALYEHYKAKIQSIEWEE